MKKLLLIGAITLSMGMTPMAFAAKTDKDSPDNQSDKTAKQEEKVVQEPRLKVGVLDIRHVMDNSSELKSIEEQLKKEFKPKLEQVQALDQGLRESVEKLQRNKDVMNETERAKLEKEIEATQRELMTLQAQYSQESSEKQQKMMQEYLDGVKKKVEEFAKKEKYDMILISDAVPYMSENIDVTKNIMEILKNKS